MAMREKITILGKAFGSKQKLKEYVQQILNNKYELHQDLCSDDLKFLIALIQQRHPEADEKLGDGIERIWIQENIVNHGKSRGFTFQRIDGSIDNFSYKACIDNPPSLESHLLMACREAVSSNVQGFREDAFREVEKRKCPTTGIFVSLKQAYVAYASPTFKELVESFKESECLVVSQELFKIHGDGDLTMKFADESICSKWISFWRENAHLEIRSKSVIGMKS